MVFERISENVNGPLFFWWSVWECGGHFFIVLKEIGLTNVQSIYNSFTNKYGNTKKVSSDKKMHCLPSERFINNYRNDLFDVGKIG